MGDTGDRHELNRRELLAYSAAFGSAFIAAQGLGRPHAAESRSQPPTAARRYEMKKSINLWALPYPDKMSLRRCFEICADAGFEGVEINYALEGDLSPDASDDQIRAIGRMARDMGLQIAGVCSFLFWPYAFTAEDRERRERGIELAGQMIHAAALLDTENVLIVPGATWIPWMRDLPPVPHEVAEKRAHAAMERLIPQAEDAGVCLNIENIFVNGFLHSPREMNAFVDRYASDRVRVHFDTGNIMQYHFPEHWIPMLGRRIQHVHMREASREVVQFDLNTVRPLLDGSVNWPEVMEALDRVGYRGYLTFEYFVPFPHHPEVLVYQTSMALDRLLGRVTA
jgi:L-ribulose-5-phosphate 3-epimerase